MKKIFYYLYYFINMKNMKLLIFLINRKFKINLNIKIKLLIKIENKFI